MERGRPELHCPTATVSAGMECVAGEEGRGYGLSTEAVGGPGCLTQSANCFPAAAERIKGKS